ncbi:hypothetical protein ACFVVA_00310 [Kitasatospora sp. NPDC058048]|uniref:hypothetical protein n=1 Tax=Kitasatospora sp. NPDC058048 TaxID=3346313 RepID=UPI0036DC9D95
MRNRVLVHALGGLAAALPLVIGGCSSAGPAATPSPPGPSPVATTTVPAPAGRTTASSPPAGRTWPTDQRAVLIGCGGLPATEPAYVVLLCGDGGMSLDQLSWAGWGGPTATATGQLWQKRCVPNCAQGGAVPFRATVTVGGLTAGGYSTLHIDAPTAPDRSIDFTVDDQGPLIVQR